MLATFVIGLREGLEAALIVGIVAAFLKQRGGTHALRWVWVGVIAALAICLTVGIILQVISADLPQRQQEGLETVIGAVAVGMVTYMVVWMRRHSRDLKGQLEGVAGTALAQGSARALIAMAFLAVLREGLETAVFLLAAFNASGNGLTAGLGALLGVVVAVILGYGIYRGGVRINLSKFFRATGLVLVLVAAGLVMTALHTAHEAGWIVSFGQDRLFDISGVVRNGSVQASLITGVLGIQAQPTEIEVIGWLVYLIPVGLYIGWPPGKRVPWRPIAWGAAVLSIACVAGAITFAAAAPAKPAAQASWTAAVAGKTSTRVSPSGFSSERQVSANGSVTWSASGASLTGSDQRSGINVQSLTREHTEAVAASEQLPTSVTLDQLRALNGGRLPIGLVSGGAVTGLIPISYTQKVTESLWRDPVTGRLLDASRHLTVTAIAQVNGSAFVLGTVGDTTQQVTSAAGQAAVAADRDARATVSRADSWGSDYPTLLGVAAAALALLALGARVAYRREAARATYAASRRPASDDSLSKVAASEHRQEHLPVR
jgi:high-affinity iron transporter